MSGVNPDGVARKYGIDRKIFRALISQESGGNQNARSPAGAIGLTQLMPGTARGLGVNPNDPAQNLEGGAKYLRQQLDRFGGDYSRALAAYNAGPGAVQKYGGIPPYKETQNYVRSILAKAGNPGDAPLGGGGGGAIRRTPTGGAARRQLLLTYLQDRQDPGAILRLGQGLQQQQAQEQPVTPVSRPRSGGGMSPLLELFYDPEGGIKRGKEIGAIGGHTDHVHVAAGPKTTLKLAKLAEQMGASVRELAPYDKVDPVHTGGSYHYSNQAADVSGSAKLMRAYYRKVKSLYGL